VAHGVVEDLLARRDEQGCVQLPKRPVFEAGTVVRIVHGSLTESLGLFEDARGSDRVSILMDLLGRKVRVRLNSEQIEAVA
jgi:transcriptional antiterminator RfaH